MSAFCMVRVDFYMVNITEPLWWCTENVNGFASAATKSYVLSLLLLKHIKRCVFPFCYPLRMA